jgi:hypothetical protein
MRSDYPYVNGWWKTAFAAFGILMLFPFCYKVTVGPDFGPELLAGFVRATLIAGLCLFFFEYGRYQGHKEEQHENERKATQDNK